MTDKTLVVGHVDSENLDDIATIVSGSEVHRSLKGLDAHKNKNYAIFEKPTPTPTKAIKILPSPAVKPAGSSKICEGKLIVGGIEMAVTAFRLP